jgi:transposase
MNAQAVADARQLVSKGMSANKAAEQVGADYGVSRQSVQAWAKAQGTPLGVVASQTAKNAREVAAEEHAALRAELRRDLLRVAALTLKAIPAAVQEGDGKQAQAFALTTAILIDKMRLEEGEATSRTESWAADEWTQQVRLLEAEISRREDSRGLCAPEPR